MAFRTQQSLSDEYRKIKATARGLRAQAVSRIAEMAAGPVEIREVTREMLPYLVSCMTVFAAPSAGMTALAKEEEEDPAYDVASEFIAMRSALQDSIDWIVANVPTDGSSRILETILNGDGSTTDVTASTAATAGLRTALQSVVNSIEP